MRIRSIKPEFWHSDDITSLEPLDRLLFVGLWSYVDDNGVGRDDLALIIGDLFPRDMVRNPGDTVARVSGGLQHLHDAGLITRYVEGGRGYLHVTTWAEHQRVDRPAKSRYPLLDPRNDADRAVIATSSRDLHEDVATGEEEEGRRGEGEQGEKNLDRSLALIDQVEAQPSVEELFAEWWGHVRRKVSKPAAETAYAKALKAIGGDRTNASTVLLDAIEEHQRHWFDLEGRSIDKIPHPSTWLSRHSWTDELPADSAYQQRATGAAAETPSQKIQRMREAAGMPAQNGGTPNGYEGRMHRPALGARVS